MPIETRPIAEAELPGWFEAASSVFFFWPWGDPVRTAELRRPAMDLQRTIAAFDGDRIVGTYRSFAAKQTVPGLGQLPVGCVSAVTVKPTHRRQGLLTSMIGLDIRDSVERGEAAGILYAAEWPIYGRFGYGPATWSSDWRLRTRSARFSKTVPWGSIEILSRTAAKDTLMAIYEEYRASQVAEISRTTQRWDNDLGLAETVGRPPWTGQVAIHRAPDGKPDGYVRYHGEEKWDEGIPDNVVSVDELHGVTQAAEIELWRYICSIDLVATAKVDGRRTREPLLWYLDDGRAFRATSTYEAQWFRLYDVPVALAARAYDRDASLVIEVVDRLADADGPAAGRYRLETGPEGATCRRTTEEPDVTVPVAALSAAYLGGTSLIDALRGRAADEHEPRALGTLDRLLTWRDEPWCSTFF